MQRRTRIQLLIAACVVVVTALCLPWFLYPSDRTPKGAYLRVMSAVNQAEPEAFFAYIETAAQHACFTLHDYSRKSYELVKASYPEPKRSETLARLKPLAEAAEGPGVFALYARKRGWMQRLRRDLSGVKSVEINGERATVETVRGTRYPFRRRENGIWGLTLFTAALVQDAEKAARDHSVIEAAARDFQAAAKPAEPGTSAPRR